jgi:heme oxygenase
MLLRLAIETRSHHNAADDDRLSLMDVKTRAEYRSFLVRIFGFEAAVEEALLRVKDVDADVMRGRLRAEHLRHDLYTLGLTPEVLEWLPRLTHVPIRTAPQALGWLFVLERSTLIAGLLRRHLERMLKDSLCGAVQYLASYGEKPGARFHALGELLGRYAHRYTPGEIVSAANEAFRSQRQWYASFGRASARGTAGGQTPALHLYAPVLARRHEPGDAESPSEGGVARESESDENLLAR